MLFFLDLMLVILFEGEMGKDRHRERCFWCYYHIHMQACCDYPVFWTTCLNEWHLLLWSPLPVSHFHTILVSSDYNPLQRATSWLQGNNFNLSCSRRSSLGPNQWWITRVSLRLFQVENLEVQVARERLQRILLSSIVRRNLNSRTVLGIWRL